MNFSWLDDGAVAGCRGPRTDTDLTFLASIGITALVRLAPEDETGMQTSDVEGNGIEDCYEPVKDWTAPSQEQIDRIIGFMKRIVKDGKGVAVSCGAGCGRTGTILACYLVSTGLTPDAAIRAVIDARPCSNEIRSVPGQERAVMDFHRRTAGRY